MRLQDFNDTSKNDYIWDNKTSLKMNDEKNLLVTITQH